MRRVVRSHLVLSVLVGSCFGATACGAENSEENHAGAAGIGGSEAGGASGAAGAADAGSDASAGGSAGSGGTAGSGATASTGGAAGSGGTAGSGGSGGSGGPGGTSSTGGSGGVANCNYDSKYCNGADVISCTKGQPPQVVATCKSAALCNANGCLDCLSGETSCAGNTLMMCVEYGNKLPVATCTTSCDPVLGRCNDCPKPGPYCDGLTLKLCGQHGDESAVMEQCDSTCDASKLNACGECDWSGGTYCDNSSMFECSPWGKKTALEQCATAQSCSDGVKYKRCGCTTQSVTATPPTYQLTKIGSPIFKPIGMTIFAAPAGADPIGMELIGPTVQSVYGNLHLMNAWNNGLVPGIQHQPPYDSEIANGVAAKGYFVSNTFADCQMYPTSGIYLLFFVAPDTGAPNGKSVDFDSGPIVPNSVFPMFLGQDLYREGVLVDPVGDSYFPASTAITPGTDGYSHLPVTWVTGMGWVPVGTPVKGNYSWKLDLIDKNGSGWTITVPFKVQ